MPEYPKRVEDLYNYGQDVFSMRANAQVPPLEKLRLLPAFLTYYYSLFRSLWFAGMWRLSQSARVEFEHWRLHDWTALHDAGLTQENLDCILKEMSLAKVMAELLGLKKAAQLRRRLSDRVSHAVLRAVFAPPEAFIACGEGDFMAAFKKFYLAYLEAMHRAGLQSAQVVEDTPDAFQVNITCCAWAEIAKVIGNPLYCYYYTCYGDEVFFPRLVESGGFKFERYGTLGQGEPGCDHRFVRLDRAAPTSSH